MVNYNMQMMYILKLLEHFVSQQHCILCQQLFSVYSHDKIQPKYLEPALAPSN